MDRRRGLVLVLSAFALSGCVTRALLRLGDPDDPPASYDIVVRDGGVLHLHYSAVMHDGELRNADDDEPIALADLAWTSVTVGPIDSACTSASWASLADGAPVSVPAVTSGRLGREEGAAVHAKLGAGSPPMSVQFEGTDFRVYCGSGDGAAYAEVVHPPAETGKPAGAIAAIVVLFPFALVADMFGGFIGYFATR